MSKIENYDNNRSGVLMHDYILSFNKINVEKNKIDRLLSLMIGNT